MGEAASKVGLGNWILFCSPDSKTNSETTNPNFHELEQGLQVFLVQFMRTTNTNLEFLQPNSYLFTF